MQRFPTPGAARSRLLGMCTLLLLLALALPLRPAQAQPPIESDQPAPTAEPPSPPADQPGLDAAPQAATRLFLPLVSDGKDAPDLSFDPPALDMLPGDTVSTVVQVNPPTDLSGATFDLDGGHDGIASSFEPAPGGITGTLTLTATEDAAGRDQSLTVLGASGEKKWVGSLKLTVTSGTGKTRFVDPATGSDGNDGSQGKPFKTIAKAMSVSKSGDTVQLAKGTYDQKHGGQQFPLTIPSGVTLQGTLNGDVHESALSADNPAQTGLIFAGGGRVKDLEIDIFENAIKASTGTQKIENVNFIFNRNSLLLTGSAHATLARSFVLLETKVTVTGAVVTDQATLKLDTTKINGAGPSCMSDNSGLVAKGVLLKGSAQLTFAGHESFDEVPGHLFQLEGSSKVTFNLGFVSKTNPADCANPASFIQVRDAARLAGTVVNGTSLDINLVAQGAKTGIGIDIDSSTPQVLRVAMQGHKIGLLLGKKTRSVEVAATNIFGCGTIIDAQAALNADINIHDSRLQSSGQGVIGLKIKLRRTKVTNNTIGVTIIGNGADLGSSSNNEAGSNDFSNNAQSGVVFDPRFSEPNLLLVAAGNQWTPHTQNSGEGGSYLTGSVVKGSDPNAKGKNFFIVKADAAIQF